MTNTHMLKTVLANEAGALIRDEMRALGQRQKLLLAARDAVVLYGLSVDEVSAVTGLDPASVQRAVTNPLVRDLATV